MDNNNQENNALGILGGEHPLMGAVAFAAFQEVGSLREKLAEAEERIRELTDVAEEIFEVIEDKLTDKIQYWMEKAEGIKGQYEAGYLYERISTIEDLINLLGEIKEKYTEGKK